VLSDRPHSLPESLALPALALLLLLLGYLQVRWLDQLALREAESRAAALAALAQGLRTGADARIATELDALQGMARRGPAVDLAQPAAAGAPMPGIAVWWVARDAARARPVWRLDGQAQARFVEAGMAEVLQASGEWGRAWLARGLDETDDPPVRAPVLVVPTPARLDAAQPAVPGYLLAAVPSALVRAAVDRELAQRAADDRLGELRFALAVGSAQPVLPLPSPVRFRGQPLAGYWSLDLQLVAGSTDRLAAQLRRRNLFVALAIIGLLGASAGLLWVTARRRRRLAGQRLEMVAAVSHELRTPLAVIHSAAANLADGITVEPGRVREYGELIRTESQRLRRLVETALQPGVLADEPGAGRGLAASQAAENLAEAIVRAIAASGVPDATTRVQVDAAVKRMPALAIPRGELDIALANLIGNALRYADPGSAVQVDASRRGRRLRLSIANRCTTLAADERARLFEPFFRGRQARQSNPLGSGLGLSLVRAVAARCGGSLQHRFKGGELMVILSLPLTSSGRP